MLAELQIDPNASPPLGLAAGLLSGFPKLATVVVDGDENVDGAAEGVLDEKADGCEEVLISARTEVK